MVVCVGGVRRRQMIRVLTSPEKLTRDAYFDRDCVDDDFFGICANGRVYGFGTNTEAVYRIGTPNVVVVVVVVAAAVDGRDENIVNEELIGDDAAIDFILGFAIGVAAIGFDFGIGFGAAAIGLFVRGLSSTRRYWGSRTGWMFYGGRETKGTYMQKIT